MLKPIINHQKKLNEIYKKIDFLRENFDFENYEAFFSELVDNAKELKNELEYHFNLQINAITHKKAKKFVLENMLVRDILFRMLDFIIQKAKQNSTDAFLKLDDFDEIYKAYLKKEKGLFKQNLKSVLNDDEIEEIAKEYKYPFYIKAEPHTDLAMKKSHLSSAKGVITLSPNIADNIAMISSVRLFENELGRIPYYIMSIADKSVDVEKLLKLGANEVINPNKLMAKRATAIAKDHKIKNLLEEFLYSRDTNLNLEEFRVPKKSLILFKK